MDASLGQSFEFMPLSAFRAESSTTPSLGPSSPSGSIAPVSPKPDERVAKERGEPVHSLEQPCAHNAWDNVRTKKGWMYFRCRTCEAGWKSKWGLFTRCRHFGEDGRCPKGAACADVHIFPKKKSLEERYAVHGEKVLARVDPDRVQKIIPDDNDNDDIPDLLSDDGSDGGEMSTVSLIGELAASLVGDVDAESDEHGSAQSPGSTNASLASMSMSLAAMSMASMTAYQRNMHILYMQQQQQQQKMMAMHMMAAAQCSATQLPLGRM
eukprot:TRINITY_DN3581_c0_g1_i1.p1 TRINITY_DN3581_c0_g1~~TRINITY_DN3581_c0_g1_i1.p1  ORF type:complete len:267 (+),score=70.77 TRINITY_DN3581_c0_g1_i1:63-863(+)